MSMCTSSMMYILYCVPHRLDVDVRPQACGCRRCRGSTRRRFRSTSTSSPAEMPWQISHSLQGTPSTGVRAVERLGQDAGHRRLADAAGAGEQVRVRDAARANGVAQRLGNMSCPTTSSNVCGRNRRARTCNAAVGSAMRPRSRTGRSPAFSKSRASLIRFNKRGGRTLSPRAPGTDCLGLLRLRSDPVHMAPPQLEIASHPLRFGTVTALSGPHVRIQGARKF